MCPPAIDTCLHQWSIDYGKMSEQVSFPWNDKLEIKTKVQDVAGTLMSVLPWYHATWNEDSPGYERENPNSYTNSKDYRSPEHFEEMLTQRDIETGLLLGHEIRFLPTVINPEYASEIATAYNNILIEDWLEATDNLAGSIVVAMNDPDAAAEEIHRCADHPDMVSVLLLSGQAQSFGHPYYRPVFKAAAEENLPITVQTSGNPVHRQTAMGLPERYETYHANLVQNYMTNLISMIFQGVFDRHPDLDVVWTGEGASWALQPGWRGTRYYRNMEPQVPQQLEKEPHEYVQDNCYFTTYPLGRHEREQTESLFEMVGTDNIVYGSGYPYWNDDDENELVSAVGEEKAGIFNENARKVYEL